MDEPVKLELVHPGSVELGEALPDVLEQPSQLFLVVGADDGSHLAPIPLVARSTRIMELSGHGDERTSIPSWALANG